MYLLEMVLHAINLQAFVEKYKENQFRRFETLRLELLLLNLHPVSVHLFCLPVWVNSYVYDVIKSVNLYHLYPTKL